MGLEQVTLQTAMRDRYDTIRCIWRCLETDGSSQQNSTPEDDAMMMMMMTMMMMISNFSHFLKMLCKWCPLYTLKNWT